MPSIYSRNTDESTAPSVFFCGTSRLRYTRDENRLGSPRLELWFGAMVIGVLLELVTDPENEIFPQVRSQDLETDGQPF